MAHFNFRFIFLTVISLFLSIVFSIASTIKGRVIDSDTHENVQGVVVSIDGTKHIVVSDNKGYYVFDNIPKGTYTLSTKMLGYKYLVKEEITLRSQDDVFDYDIYLRPDSRLLNNVEVKAAKNKETDVSARMDEKLAPNIINIMSAKTIETLPDLNVANVMQRVSGVSMVKNSTGNNTEAIIRGMPPRYSNTLINGSAAPSTSGSVRSVPLDIIPSNLVGRVEVTKALTPDQEGNGLGGTVNVEMKDAPEQPLFSLDIATGYNQYFFDHKLSTFNTGVVSMKDPAELHGNDYLANLSDFSKGNMVINQVHAPLDLNGSLSFGHRYFHNKLGVLISATATSTNQGSNDINYTPDLSVYNVITYTSKNRKIYDTQALRIGSNIKLDYQINNKNKISLYNSYFQLREDRARNETDTTSEINWGRVGSKDITNRDISTLNSFNLQGHHQLLNNLDIDWTFLYSVATSQSPDLVTVNYIQIIHPTVQPVYLNYSGCVTREWQHNTDENKDAYLNIKYKPIFFDHIYELKVGGMARVKFRNNYANEYTFDAPIVNPGNPDIQSVEVTQNRNAQQRNGNPVNNPGNYKATENIEAAYGQVKTNFGKLQILTGIRVEFTYQTNYHSETQNVLVPFTTNKFKYYDVLPSLHLNYQITDKQNMRLSAYQGISRPNYTDLVDYYAQGVNGGTQGNPHLNHSTGTCYDARYELYINKEEMLTGGVFYKYIEHPIVDMLGANNQITPKNLSNPCTNYGFELVGIKYFGKFGISCNYTYTSSRMEYTKNYYPSADVIEKRIEIIPLVGQSPHIINAAINYRDLSAGFKCQLVYTMQGENLKSIQSDYGADTYQKTFHDLGATLEKTLLKNILLYAKVNNILNSKVEYYIKKYNGVQESISTSMSFLVGLKYNL